jgi:hypothetical protein
MGVDCPDNDWIGPGELCLILGGNEMILGNDV